MHKPRPPGREPKLKVAFTLEKWQVEKLRELAYSQGLYASELLRKILDEYFEKLEAKEENSSR